MTSVADTAPTASVDWRLVVFSGAKLGIATSVGVAIFAFLSRGMSGTTEALVQSALILVGGVVFSFGPAVFLRPVDVDSVAWTAMIGLMGALVFTVVDVVLFRNINLYHWTWDAIGGGSSYWYIPVWWMGSAFLAWLGSWAVANGGPDSAIPPVAIRTVVMGVVLAAVLIGVGITPFHSASVALAFALSLVVGVPVSSMMRKG